MHIAIDIVAGIILLFFFLSGWHKGTLLSLLGIARVVLSYVAAYFSGRYLGYWLGEVTHRPRLISIPVVAIFTFALIGFLFRIVMHGVRARHKEKAKEEEFHLTLPSCLTGGTINLAGGIFTMVLIFWLGELFLVGVSGQTFPGADRSNFARFSRRTVFEVCYAAVPKRGHHRQVETLSRMISNPGASVGLLENILSAASVKQLLADKEFSKAIMSGEPRRIRENASFQQLINDRETISELVALGFLSEKGRPSSLSEQLSRIGQNERIRSSVENLQAENLLSADKITLLIRDPDFDTIIAELAK